MYCIILGRLNYIYELKRGIDEVIEDEKKQKMEKFMNDDNILEFDPVQYGEVNLDQVLFNSSVNVGSRNIKIYFTSFFLFSYPDIHSLLISYGTYLAMATFIVYSLFFYAVELISVGLLFTASSSSVFCLFNVIMMVLSSLLSLRKSRKLSAMTNLFFRIVMFVLFCG
jgi:hypothetical protein